LKSTEVGGFDSTRVLPAKLRWTKGFRSSGAPWCPVAAAEVHAEKSLNLRGKRCSLLHGFGRAAFTIWVFLTFTVETMSKGFHGCPEEGETVPKWNGGSTPCFPMSSLFAISNVTKCPFVSVLAICSFLDRRVRYRWLHILSGAGNGVDEFGRNRRGPVES